CGGCMTWAPKILDDVRLQMKMQEIDFFLQPTWDEYQSEYPPKSAERLAYLTGFTGSNGLAIVGAQTAVVFSDGRYSTQLKNQLNPTYIEHEVVARDVMGLNALKAWFERIARQGN